MFDQAFAMVLQSHRWSVNKGKGGNSVLIIYQMFGVLFFTLVQTSVCLVTLISSIACLVVISKCLSTLLPPTQGLKPPHMHGSIFFIYSTGLLTGVCLSLSPVCPLTLCSPFSSGALSSAPCCSLSFPLRLSN